MKTIGLSYHLFHVALGILRDNGGAMGPSELLQVLEEREGDRIPPKYRRQYRDGSIRWVKEFRFYSIRFVKAGLLKKSGGRWYLTPEGEAASRRSEKKVAAEVQEVYEQSGKESGLKSGAPKQAGTPADDEVGDAPDASLDVFEDKARDGIVGQIKKMAPGDLEQLVAALLRGMAYYTPIVASGGPDGGVDVLAYRDPLGATTPRLKVQVKHQMVSAKKASRKELQTLNGLLTEGESGVFVATAGFAPTVREFVRTTNNHLELIDMDRLIDLWREHYDALSDEDKALLPLRRISFLDGERVRNL